MEPYKRIKMKHGTMLIDAKDWEKWKHINWNTHPHHTDGKYYVSCSIHMKRKYNLPTTRLHRLILNAKKGQTVDHKFNTLDNRKAKLRICNLSQNALNRVKFTGTSKYKGVFWCKEQNKWRVRFRNKHIGRFIDEDEAGRAYNKVAKEYDKEFTLLNKIK